MADRQAVRAAAADGTGVEHDSTVCAVEQALAAAVRPKTHKQEGLFVKGLIVHP